MRIVNPVLIAVLIILSILILYFLAIFLATFYFARIPRSIYDASPDLGKLKDHRIKVNKKEIELWVVYHEDQTKDTVILTHAWGRDRGRMISRARKWYNLGFNTIILSARDHGGSDRLFTGMHLLRFKEDVDAVINWWNKPVFLHGHSAGGGASILAGSTHPLVRGVVAESAPRVMTSGLNEFFKPFSLRLTRFVYPGTKLIMRMLFIKYQNYEVNPILAANKSCTPMLLLYALDDEVFNDVKRTIREWSELPNINVAEFETGGHSTIVKQSNYQSVIGKFVNELTK